MPKTPNRTADASPRVVARTIPCRAGTPHFAQTKPNTTDATERANSTRCRVFMFPPLQPTGQHRSRGIQDGFNRENSVLRLDFKIDRSPRKAFVRPDCLVGFCQFEPDPLSGCRPLLRINGFLDSLSSHAVDGNRIGDGTSPFKALATEILVEKLKQRRKNQPPLSGILVLERNGVDECLDMVRVFQNSIKNGLPLIHANPEHRFFRRFARRTTNGFRKTIFRRALSKRRAAVLFTSSICPMMKVN